MDFSFQESSHQKVFNGNFLSNSNQKFMKRNLIKSRHMIRNPLKNLKQEKPLYSLEINDLKIRKQKRARSNSGRSFYKRRPS